MFLIAGALLAGHAFPQLGTVYRGLKRRLASLSTANRRAVAAVALAAVAAAGVATGGRR